MEKMGEMRKTIQLTTISSHKAEGGERAREHKNPSQEVP